jgi:S-adenosylmethionine:tRNA ribosyltransferase-isomerase
MAEGARLSDYDYAVPPGAVAQRPAHPRDSARLLVLRRGTGALEDRVFRDLPGLLDPRDVLVRNDTRVIPARLLGRRHPSGGAVEVFLLRPADAASPAGAWHALLGPAKRMRVGTRVRFDGTDVVGEVVAEGEEGERTVRFVGADGAPADALDLAERVGRPPLPPYVRRDADAADRVDYQTVYARAPGAVAAPTAGLHFTDATFSDLRARGIEVASLTLHVGLGTFRPVLTDDVESHRMHEEEYDVPPAAAAAIARARARGGRVVAVGTTTVRALETVAARDGVVRAGRGSTRAFLRPPHEFRAVDALVTNFHLPRSTLLMLVSALAGRERVLAAYAHAAAAGYRFHSYGDAMLIL